MRAPKKLFLRMLQMDPKVLCEHLTYHSNMVDYLKSLMDGNPIPEPKKPRKALKHKPAKAVNYFSLSLELQEKLLPDDEIKTVITEEDLKFVDEAAACTSKLEETLKKFSTSYRQENSLKFHLTFGHTLVKIKALYHSDNQSQTWEQYVETSLGISPRYERQLREIGLKFYFPKFCMLSMPISEFLKKKKEIENMLQISSLKTFWTT